MIAGRLTVVAGVVVAVLAGAEAANALISSNTIDELVTHKQDGQPVRDTGPIGCTRERIALHERATPTYRWHSRCCARERTAMKAAMRRPSVRHGYDSHAVFSPRMASVGCLMRSRSPA